MKEELFRLFWENAKRGYYHLAGESVYTNAIIESDFESMIEEILLIKAGEKLLNEIE